MAEIAEFLNAHAARHNAAGADALAIDAAAATGSLRTLGAGAAQACGGTDARLSDARAPTAHAASHNAGGGDALAIDAAAATGSLRTLGAGAAQACGGTDARLSDARTPTAHAASHNAGGADALAIDAAAATGSLRTLGAGAAQACGGTDARLSDARTPTAHAASHVGADAIAAATQTVAGFAPALNVAEKSAGALVAADFGQTRVLVLNIPAGASAALDFTGSPYKFRVVEVLLRKDGTSADAGDTGQLQTGAGASITPVFALNTVDDAIVRTTAIDDANREIAVAGTLRWNRVQSTAAGCEVYVTVILMA